MSKKIIVTGNVVKDAEVRAVNDKNVINFTVASNERFTDKEGNKRTIASYFNCSMWRDKTTVAQYIKKGTKVYVDGSPSAEYYETKGGEKMALMKIRVTDFELLGGNSKPAQEPQSSTTAPASENSEGPPTPDDDLPF